MEYYKVDIELIEADLREELDFYEDLISINAGIFAVFLLLKAKKKYLFETQGKLDLIRISTGGNNDPLSYSIIGYILKETGKFQDAIAMFGKAKILYNQMYHKEYTLAQNNILLCQQALVSEASDGDLIESGTNLQTVNIAYAENQNNFGSFSQIILTKAADLLRKEFVTFGHSIKQVIANIVDQEAEAYTGDYNKYLAASHSAYSVGKYEEALIYQKLAVYFIMHSRQEMSTRDIVSILHNLGCIYQIAAFESTVIEKEENIRVYLNKAEKAFKGALVYAKGLADIAGLHAEYAGFLIKQERYIEAVDHLNNAISSADFKSALMYAAIERKAIPEALHRIMENSIHGTISIKAILYAYYLLILNYEKFQEAGIDVLSSKEEYLAAFASSTEQISEGSYVPYVLLADLHELSGDQVKSDELLGRASMLRAQAMHEQAESSGEENKQEDESGRGSINREGSVLQQYYVSAISALLPLRLHGARWIIKAPLVIISNHCEDMEQTVQDSYSSSCNLSELNAGLDTVILPILYKGLEGYPHWVGVIISKVLPALQITYLDSENSPMSDIIRYYVLEIIEALFKTSRSNLPIIFQQQSVEQQRYNNCGPELIENFIYYLTGNRATQEAAVYVHSLLLENALLDPIEYALKISENSKLIGFLSNQALLMFDRPITDTDSNGLLGMFMRQTEVKFEMPMLAAKTSLSELPLVHTQYLDLKRFDCVKQVSTPQTITMSRDPVLVVDNEVSSDQEPATLLAQNIVPAILPIQPDVFSIVSSTALVAIASGADSAQQVSQALGSGLFTFIHTLTDKITSTLSYGLMNAGSAITNAVMQNNYLKHQLINYVYHEELSAINTVINQPYVQSSEIPTVQLLLQKHPLQWSKKDFKQIKLVVHPDKGGEAEDFHTVNAFEELVGDKDQMYQNLLPKLLPNIQTVIHKSNVWFKVLDMAVDSGRLIYEPTLANTKKVALDSTYLSSMYHGVNGYSSIISAVDVLQLAYQEEYLQAIQQAVTTTAYMALPSLLAYTAIPHLGIAYGIGMATYTTYTAITNSYSFYLERTSDPESILRSTMAYRDLAQTLSTSPLQQLYDFASATKGYELQLNNIALVAEQEALKAKLVEEKGEFAQKLYDYIYRPALEEKYSLLNQVLQGSVTAEETENLKAKHITIISNDQSYDHCLEIKDVAHNDENNSGTKSGTNSNSKSGSNKNSKASTADEHSNVNIEHYYCYNDEKKLLDYVLIGDNHFEVVDSF